VETFNRADQSSWNQIFQHIPPEWEKAWKASPPSPAMTDCLRFFRERDVHSVLDLGCGVGIWSLYLARNGMTVKGIDFSLPAIAFARQWAEEEALAPAFAVAPITEAPFEGEVFDAVVASQILDNVSREEMAKAIGAMRGRLRPGGVVFALFNPFVSEAQLVELRNSDNPTKDITQVVYSDEELRGAFPGFTLVELKTYPQGQRALCLAKD
jgi:SAM-dependent methyltransferase